MEFYTSRARFALIITLLIAGFAITCTGQTPADLVLDRVNRLRAIVPIADEFKDQREQVLSALDDLEAAAREGQSYLALYRLQSLWTSIQPVEYAKSRSAVTKEGLPGFEKAWRRLSTELKAKEASIDKSNTTRLPMAVRGLIQICLTKSQAYYESSRPFGEDVQIKSGLYYMGVANAELDFASLCLKQDFAGQSSAPAFHSLRPELQQLDNRIVEVYKQRDSSELVEEFIALSSNMEFANQLERAGRHDGALIAYLDTVLKLGLLETGTPPVERAAGLTEGLDQIAGRLGGTNYDDSVGQIYYAMARRSLARATSAAKQADDLKKTCVLVDRVLPAYFSTIAETKR